MPGIPRSVSAALALACLVGTARSQNPTASLPASGTYFQDFDLLRQNNAALAPNTMPGVLNRVDQAPFTAAAAPNSLTGFRFRSGSGAGAIFQRSDGSATQGGGYSYGNAFNDGEAALGVLTSGSFTGSYFGLVIRNNTGAAQTSVTVTYTGEQWRNAGRNDGSADRLDVRYLLGSNELFGPTFGTAVPGLTFSSPVVTGSAGPLDGNAAANRTTLTQTITFGPEQWDEGEDLVLSWFDANINLADDGLGIDNLTIFVVPVPEPTGLLGVAFVVAAGRRVVRRRRSVVAQSVAGSVPS